jgi:dsRNA-specific ribonuclease
MATKPSKKIDPKLEPFLRHLIGIRGMVNDANLEKIMTKSNIAEFQKAFTHRSFDPVDHFDMYEHLGDPIVNAFTSLYIHQRFPEIKNVGYASKIWANLKGKRHLALISRKQFTGLVRYSEEWVEEIKIENPNLEKNIEFRSLYEDAFEAFCGCLVDCITRVGFGYGAAIEVCHNILRTFFDAETISIKYEDVYDPVTRLKELYTSTKFGLRWVEHRDATYYQGIKGKMESHPPRGDKYQTIEKLDGAGDKYRVKIWGWPLGDKKVKLSNEMLLAEVEAYGKAAAKAKASKIALRVLDSQFHIRDVPVDPLVPSHSEFSKKREKD